MTKHQKSACVKFYEDFHQKNATLLDECVKEGCTDRLAEAHSRVFDLHIWIDILENKSEVQIYRNAFKEYEFSMLCLVQGFYRQAFSSLRLFMELTLAAVLLSTNELDMRLWFAGKKDTNWKSMMDADKGIFAKNFVESFCPELIDESKHFQSASEKLYRECSEYVHGNHATNISLPDEVAFSKEAFILWTEKAKSVFLVVQYVLTVRYINEMNADKFNKLEGPLNDVLGHIKGFGLILNEEKK